MSSIRSASVMIPNASNIVVMTLRKSGSATFCANTVGQKVIRGLRDGICVHGSVGSAEGRVGFVTGFVFLVGRSGHHRHLNPSLAPKRRQPLDFLRLADGIFGEFLSHPPLEVRLRGQHPSLGGTIWGSHLRSPLVRVTQGTCSRAPTMKRLLDKSPWKQCLPGFSRPLTGFDERIVLLLRIMERIVGAHAATSSTGEEQCEKANVAQMHAESMYHVHGKLTAQTHKIFSR